MLIEVERFCEVARDPDERHELIRSLQEETGRSGADEAWAWDSSLPTLATALDHPRLKPLHLHLGVRGQLSLEYRLPASASWADAVLLGRRERKPGAVFLELKDWQVTNDQPGPRPGLVWHNGALCLHPSEQLRGYVEYCRRFHSAVLEREAEVAGAVLFTGTLAADVYRQEPHDELTRSLPVFTAHARDIKDRLPGFVADRLDAPDPVFAEQFEGGTYRQDRSFVRQVAQALTTPGTSPFVLLDRQREGFEHCLRLVDEVLSTSGAGEKAVVLVEGPPGSGKSVLAAQLWAHLALDDRIAGNVVLTTTSAAQRTNMKHLFSRASGELAAGGLVKPAVEYNPGLTTAWVKTWQTEGRRIESSAWKQNLSLWRRQGGKERCRENAFDVSIVDEAHALVDPSVEGIPLAMGVVMQAGPQAWHVMRASRISIFLLDPEQSFRHIETTSKKRIRELAADLGIQRIEEVDLSGAQFRCGGSTEYMSWLDHLLDVGTRPPGSGWRTEEGGPFHFEVVSDPDELDERLRAHATQGSKVRLAASFARPWKTKGSASPWTLPPAQQDFDIEYRRGDSVLRWSRPWNHVLDMDYTPFVQATPGSRMAEDPLAEVGCPYVVRGFDFDYVGVLWLSDLVWRGRWVANLDQVHEVAFRSLRARAKREDGEGPATRELVSRLQRGYRILLSRAIRGVFVWFEDEETRRYVEAKLSSALDRE